MDFDELPIGTCYRKKRAKTLRKKTGDETYITIGNKGPRRGRERGGAVRPQSCSLPLIGAGMGSRPMEVLELGCGQKRRKRK